MIVSTVIALGAASAAGVLAAAQGLPVATAFPQIRVPVAPGLAGIGKAGHIALTFDDGPHQVATPRLLDLLRERHLKATFFLLGRMTAGLPTLAAEIAAEGHDIALHGRDHRSLLRLGPRATYRDIAESRDVVADVTGRMPTYYRPPYGVMTGSGFVTARRLELRPVLWSAAGQDWAADATPASINNMIFKDLRSGGTILLHDSDVTSARESWRNTLAAVPVLLDRCEEQGLVVGPLSEHWIGQEANVGSAGASRGRVPRQRQPISQAEHDQPSLVASSRRDDRASGELRSSHEA